MARFGAEPNNLVGRGSDQQVFRGGRSEADLQSGVKAGARCVQNTYVHVEQLGGEKKLHKPVSKGWNLRISRFKGQCEKNSL